MIPASRPTVAEVDLDAIAANTLALRGYADVPVIAVVKADGYGHGAEAVSRACLGAGAELLAVATIEEARVLRAAGIRAPLLALLGVENPAEAQAAVDADLHVAAWREDQLEWLDGAAGSTNAVPIHMKVDTGLTRLGVAPSEAPAFGSAVRRSRGLRLDGVYTHFASADEPDLTVTRAQLECFGAVLRALDDPPRWQHAAATAGILALGREASFTAVRPGLGLYGLPAAPHLEAVLPLRPALTLRSRLVRVRRVPGGTGVSYGHRYVTRSERVIGTLPCGYGDGLPRRASRGARVLVRGVAVPIVGSVGMDLCMLDVTDVPDVREGDVVTLIGEDGGARVTADDLARSIDTINYEVVTNLHARVPRLYRRAERVVATKTLAEGYRTCP